MASLRWDDGRVSAAWDGGGDSVVALTHGAGGDMDDPILVGIATELADRGVAFVRFNLPYREAGRRAPGSPKAAEACWRSVAATLRTEFKRTFLGGKSYGGRMASHVVADGADCDGLVLLSYPLHPPGKPDRLRDEHLASIGVPILFCQGTRDAFATPELLDATVAKLPTATLRRVDGGDHSLRVKGRSPADVASDLADAVSTWLDD